MKNHSAKIISNRTNLKLISWNMYYIGTSCSLSLERYIYIYTYKDSKLKYRHRYYPFKNCINNIKIFLTITRCLISIIAGNNREKQWYTLAQYVYCILCIYRLENIIMMGAIYAKYTYVHENEEKDRASHGAMVELGTADHHMYI